MNSSTPYEEALRAMEKLLVAVGEKFWAEWIRDDIKRWKTKHDVSHHLAAYGGMGTFNDILIRRSNEYNITSRQEPWAQAVFEWLKSLCLYLARHPSGPADAATLRKDIGLYDSGLEAFIGGHNAPRSMKGLHGPVRTIEGWRCLHCGHPELTDKDIEWFLAYEIVPELLFEACEKEEMAALVDRVLAVRIPGRLKLRQLVKEALTRSGIVLTKRRGNMRPCPACRDNDTACYRWDLAIRKGLPCFVPAKNNLYLR